MNPDELAQQLGGSVASQTAPTNAPNNPDALAASLGGSVGAAPDPSIGQRALSFVGNTVNNVERPFVNVASTPMQLAIAGINKLTGKNIPDPYQTQGIPGFPGSDSTIKSSSATDLGGLSQKAGDVANIALMAAAPEAKGVRALTLLGAGQGLSQGLGTGETDANSLIKDTISGGLFGGALGAASNFLRWTGGVEQAKTGVVGQVANEIKQADPSLVQKYINTTLDHANDVRIPTPDAIAEDAMANRANLLVNKVIPAAGKAVGEAKAAAGKLPLTIAQDGAGAPSVGSSAVDSIQDQINEAMQNMTGHQFASYASGEDGGLQIMNYKGASANGISALPGEPNIAALPGRNVELSSSETKQLSKLSDYLSTLRENPTVQTASDVIQNLDNDIGKWSVPQFGENAGNTPVEGVLRYARGTINQAIRGASPELANANDAYSALKDLQANIGVAGGKNLRSASLLMRRVLSGDKSSEAIPVLDQLTQATQGYMPAGDSSNLVQHAILADWAKRTFGDTTTSGLLQQSVNHGVRDASSIFDYPRQFVQNILQNAIGALSPDPAEYAMSVAKGHPYSMNPVVRGIDELMNSAKDSPAFGNIVKGLQEMGVKAHNIEPAANNLFKTWLLQTVTHPANLAPQGGGIGGFTPANTPQRSLTQ